MAVPMMVPATPRNEAASAPVTAAITLAATWAELTSIRRSLLTTPPFTACICGGRRHREISKGRFEATRGGRSARPFWAIRELFRIRSGPVSGRARPREWQARSGPLPGLAAAAHPGRDPVRALPRPTPGMASPGGTHLLAVDLNGRTEQRTAPARCPADHGRAIRLTPHSSDPADTRNQDSDLGHPQPNRLSPIE